MIFNNYAREASLGRHCSGNATPIWQQAAAPKQLAHKLQNNERQVQCIFWFEFYIHRPADYYFYIMGLDERSDVDVDVDAPIPSMLNHCSSELKLGFHARAHRVILMRSSKCFLIALKILFKRRAHMSRSD